MPRYCNQLGMAMRRWIASLKTQSKRKNWYSVVKQEKRLLCFDKFMIHGFREKLYEVHVKWYTYMWKSTL